MATTMPSEASLARRRRARTLVEYREIGSRQINDLARRDGAEYSIVMHDPDEGSFCGEPCLAASRNFVAHEPTSYRCSAASSPRTPSLTRSA
jgi:hypothetical protein